MASAPYNRFPSFEDFWPYYVRQHLDPTCRALHFLGLTLAIGCVALGVLSSGRYLLLAPILGYGCSWIGHFVFERNKPASFGNPLLSFFGDVRMWWLMLTGRMGAHLDAARGVHL